MQDFAFRKMLRRERAFYFIYILKLKPTEDLRDFT